MNLRLVTKKIINICFSVSILLITLEVSARLDDKMKYGGPLLGVYKASRLTMVDSDGIGHNVPNSSFEKWKINKYGFRGPDILLQKPPNIIRVACMGSSESFGLFESPEKEWPAQLAGKLNKNEHHFQVINASVAGLSQRNYESYIKKYLLKFTPDIVLLYINPFFYAGRIEKSEKKITKKNSEKTHNEKSSLSLRKAITSLRIFSKFNQTVKGIIPPKLLKKYRFRKNLKIVKEAEREYLNGEKAEDVFPSEKLEILQRDLIKLISFLKNRNINIVLSTYPTLFSQRNVEKYPEILLDYRRYCIYYSFKGLIDASVKFNDMVKEIAKREQCGFLDNYIILGDNKKYFGDAVHYTNKGAELIAENFANYIKKNYK